MPRDRPASGGNDSTLDGEFPSDLGGGGSKVMPEKVSAPYGSDGYTKPAFVGNTAANAGDGTDATYDNNILYGYMSPSPIMRINNSKFKDTLSGIYQFTAGYFVSYSSVGGAGTGASYIQTYGTYTDTDTFSLTSDQYLGQLHCLFDISGLQGETAFSQSQFYIKASVTGISPDYYNNIESPEFKVYNANSITISDSLRMAVYKAGQPVHKVQSIMGNGNIRTFSVFRTGGISGTINLTISNTNANSISVSRLDVDVIAFSGFDTGDITNTLASSL